MSSNKSDLQLRVAELLTAEEGYCNTIQELREENARVKDQNKVLSDALLTIDEKIGQFVKPFMTVVTNAGILRNSIISMSQGEAKYSSTMRAQCHFLVTAFDDNTKEALAILGQTYKKL